MGFNPLGIIGPLLGLGSSFLNDRQNKRASEAEEALYKLKLEREAESRAELAPVKKRMRFLTGIYEPSEAAEYRQWLLNDSTKPSNIATALSQYIYDRGEDEAPYHIRGRSPGNVFGLLQSLGDAHTQANAGAALGNMSLQGARMLEGLQSPGPHYSQLASDAPSYANMMLESLAKLGSNRR